MKAEHLHIFGTYLYNSKFNISKSINVRKCTMQLLQIDEALISTAGRIYSLTIQFYTFLVLDSKIKNQKITLNETHLKHIHAADIIETVKDLY